MNNNFLKIINNNPDFSPLYRLISKYIETKYTFLKPRFYNNYMSFGDELNNFPILISTDASHKKLLIISRYNTLSKVINPNKLEECTVFIDSIIRSYNYKKASERISINYVVSENDKILSKAFHKGAASIYQRRNFRSNNKKKSSK